MGARAGGDGLRVPPPPPRPRARARRTLTRHQELGMLSAERSNDELPKSYRASGFWPSAPAASPPRTPLTAGADAP